jgi:hypothetical protein
MLPLAYYLLNVILCSGLLFGYYLIALRNKKFHQYNRFYLLLTVALSVIIPLLKIQFWDEAAQQPSLIKLLTSMSATEDYARQITFKEASVWDWELFASCIFSVISAIIFLVLVSNLTKLFLQIKNHPKKIWNNICFVFSNTKGTPYSFFKYIFWNNTIDINTNEGKHVLQHELTHVQQKHSADKLFINIVLVAAWANPFFWFIRKELNIIHEFIADQKSIAGADADEFAAMLLSAAYPQHSFMLTNSFFHSPIKRRLLMLTTSKLPSYSYLRRLMILPLLLLVTILFAFKVKEKVARKIDKTFTAIVDDRTVEAPEGEKTATQTFQDTGLKKNERQIVLDKGTKITITNGHGTIAEIPADASKPILDSTKNSKLLVVLDGEQMSWKEFGEKNLQPEQIMQMSVLKDKSATDKYGQKGQFGVIEITTKSQKATITNVQPEKIDKEQEKGALENKKLTTLQQQNSQQLYQQQQKQFQDQQQQFKQQKLKQQQSQELNQLNEQQQYLQQKLMQLQQKQKQLQDQKQPQERQLSSSQQSKALGNGTTSVTDVQLEELKQDKEKHDKVFTKVEQPAKFPGGEEAWKRYLARNLNTKVAASKGVYTVNVKFIVNEDGSINNVSAEVPKDCQECGQEAIKLIKKGPKWEPAVQNGRTVVYQVVKEITFNVD